MYALLNRKRIILNIILYISILIGLSVLIYILNIEKAEVEIDVKSDQGIGVILYTDNCSAEYPFGGVNGGCYVESSLNKIHHEVESTSIDKIRIDFHAPRDFYGKIVIRKIEIKTPFGKRVYKGVDIEKNFEILCDYEILTNDEGIELILNGEWTTIQNLNTKLNERLNVETIISLILLSILLFILLRVYESILRKLYNKEVTYKNLDLILGGGVCLLSAFLLLMFERLAFNTVPNIVLFHTMRVIAVTALIIAATYSLMYVLVGKATCVLSPFLFILLEIFNYYYRYIRGEWMCPWDFQSAGEASRVVSIDILKWDNAFLVLIVISVISVMAMIPLIFNEKFKSFSMIIKKRFIALLSGSVMASIVFFLIVSRNSFGIHQFVIDDTFNRNGVIISFAYFLQNVGVSAPENYSEKTIKYIESKYKNQEKKENITPNIIVIMDEAFWDPSILPNVSYENTFLKDYYEMIDEGSMSGYILSPRFGGATCDVEFEALTGFSTDYVQNGVMPYQGIVWKKEHFYSIVNFLNKEGYVTSSIHPNTGDYYHRSKVYSSFGFQHQYWIDDIKGKATRAWFIDDEYVVDKIIEEYNANSGDKKFIFAVTIQNHNPYGGVEYPEEDAVRINYKCDVSEDVEEQLSDFSSAVNMSSKALGKLIEYLKTVDEPTIVIFWGDHMVNLGSSSYKSAIETGYISSSEDDAVDYLMYLTPFVVWDNFSSADTDKEIMTMSTFQLMPYVFSHYNMDMPSYFRFLDDLRTYSTGRSHNKVVLDSHGEPCVEDESMSEYYKKMELLNYDYIYGEGYAKSFWDQ